MGGMALGPWARALSAWWRKDRIRASPTDGKLLGLDTHSLIEIDGTILEIMSRSIRSTPAGPIVTYEARSTTDGLTGELSVQPGQCKVMWTVATGTVELDRTAVGCYCHDATDTFVR